MIRFIKDLFYGWASYPSFHAFFERLKEKNPKYLERMESSDLKLGIKPFKGRADYAFRYAKRRMKHRRRGE